VAKKSAQWETKRVEQEEREREKRLFEYVIDN